MTRENRILGGMHFRNRGSPRMHRALYNGMHQGSSSTTLECEGATPLTTHHPFPSQQTRKFPPTSSIHSTSPSHVRMIKLRYCTLTVITISATLAYVSLPACAPASRFPFSPARPSRIPSATHLLPSFSTAAHFCQRHFADKPSIFIRFGTTSVTDRGRVPPGVPLSPSHSDRHAIPFKCNTCKTSRKC